MTELELRLHCLVLAVQSLQRQHNHQTTRVTAEQFYEFLAPSFAGTGIEHNAANLHRTHPTIQ